ncbi:hypothetical protein [Aestuariivivens insulae]|uniref:hypothetical protein n=1 Tax=Aestuariivivens insulae TaxID=1621988 RepID=UPI001F59445E|nr:hypothetical protein [Aestuariivivens insulae]
MENKTINSQETLILSNYVFVKMLDKIVTQFKVKYKVESHINDTQLFGFGNFDTTKPCLKEEFQTIVRQYVNGKYLYNKHREATTGKPLIKISKSYKYVFFKYLGFSNVYDFIDQDFIPKKQKKKQLELLNKENTSKDYYFVSYYLGEDRHMNKGQVLIYNDWKTVEMKYAYEEGDASIQIYSFFGNIIKSENLIHFNTKFFAGDKKIEGAKFIFFVGKSAPTERHYLIGTYAGFDKYDQTVAGKMILKKMDSKTEMEDEALSNDFNPLMSQELIGNRIVVESNIRKNPLLFSKKSPYAEVLTRITGSYEFTFQTNDEEYVLGSRIQPKHYGIVSLQESIILEDEKVSVLNKGQILNLDFTISGMFYLQKVSIYIATYYFIDSSLEPQGKFTGVDINNNIVTGTIKMKNLD